MVMVFSIGTLEWKTNWSSLRCLHIHSRSKFTHTHTQQTNKKKLWALAEIWVCDGESLAECILVEIGMVNVRFLAELIAVYLDNSSCWSKSQHPSYHRELSWDSLPWISLEKAHLPSAQVYALDNPSLKQPCPYLLTIIILLSPFGSNRDRISLWKALWISDTIAKANAKFSVTVSVNVL